MSTTNTYVLAVKRILAILLARARKLVGSFLQVLESDQLDRLEHETRRLGSASVESVTYIGGELQALAERLSRLEEELAAVRQLLEQRADGSGDQAQEADEIEAPSSSR
jgi:hypothetical protein